MKIEILKKNLKTRIKNFWNNEKVENYINWGKWDDIVLNGKLAEVSKEFQYKDISYSLLIKRKFNNLLDNYDEQIDSDIRSSLYLYFIEVGVKLFNSDDKIKEKSILIANRYN